MQISQQALAAIPAAIAATLPDTATLYGKGTAAFEPGQGIGRRVTRHVIGDPVRVRGVKASLARVDISRGVEVTENTYQLTFPLSVAVDNAVEVVWHRPAGDLTLRVLGATATTYDTCVRVLAELVPDKAA